MKAKNQKVLAIVQTALIAAMYAALTYAQALLLPNSTTAAVQFRVSEALNVLALFTPACTCCARSKSKPSPSPPC